MGGEHALDGVEDGEERTPEIMARVVARVCLEAQEHDLVLCDPSGQSGRAPKQQDRRERDLPIADEAKVRQQFFRRLLREVGLPPFPRQDPLELTDRVGVQIGECCADRRLSGQISLAS